MQEVWAAQGPPTPPPTITTFHGLLIDFLTQAVVPSGLRQLLRGL